MQKSIQEKDDQSMNKELLDDEPLIKKDVVADKPEMGEIDAIMSLGLSVAFVEEELKEAKIDEVVKPLIWLEDTGKVEEVKEISICHEMIVTPVLEHIDTFLKKDKDVFTLFQTFEDSSSEYKMKKIRLNESDFLEFFDGLKDARVDIVAFFGEFAKCMDLAE